MDSNKRINYAKAGTYYMFGNMFKKGISFLTVPIFTRILSTTDYGIVTTYNSWIAILSMVFGFALHMGIRMAFVDYKDQVDDFLATIITFTIESSLILSLIIVAMTSLTGINLSLTLIVLCLLQAVSSAITEDYSMYLMMRFYYKTRTALMVLPNLLSAILSIITILFLIDNDLYLGRIVPTALVSIIIAIYITILVLKKGQNRHYKPYIKYGLKISAPLIIHGIALNILSQSDRTMITILADASQTGVYSLIYNFSMLATVITTSLEGVWTPWFMRKYGEHSYREINLKVIDYVNFITYAMIGLILIGPEIVKILASESYWEGIIIIPPIVLSNYMIFLYTFFVNIEHYNKKTLHISLNTIVAAITNIILNYIFIPYYGYIAAAFTTLVSYGLSFFMHYRYARKICKELYPLYLFIPSLVHILFAMLIFYVAIDNTFFRICILSAYLIIVTIQNKRKIIDIFYSKKK